MSMREIHMLSMYTPPGGSRHDRVRGVRSDWRLGWKLVAAAAWGILDSIVPSISRGDSGSIWIAIWNGLVVHSTLLVTSVSFGLPIRGTGGGGRRGGPHGVEGIEEPWECSSGSPLIAPPNRGFDARPGVLEPYTRVKCRPSR